MKLRTALVFSLAVAVSGFTASALADPAAAPAPAAPAAAPAPAATPAPAAPAAPTSMDQMAPAPAKAKKPKAKVKKASVDSGAKFQHCLKADMADADFFCKSHDAASCQQEKDGVTQECKAEAEGKAPKG